MTSSSDILNEFASEVAQAPSYSSVYNSASRTSAAAVKPGTPALNENFVEPSSVGSSLSSVENYFSSFSPSSESFSALYPSVGQGETTAEKAANLADTAVVNSTPFGFANALFENQLTPDSVSSIVGSQGSTAKQNSFVTNALSFLTPRVTPAQASTVLNEFGVPAAQGSAAPPGGAPGTGTYGPSGAGPTSDATTLTPDNTNNSSTDPAQQQQQQQQQQPQQPQGGGPIGGSSSSDNPLSSVGSGILASLEQFAHDHPVLTVVILAVGAMLLFGGSSGGGRRR